MVEQKQLNHIEGKILRVLYQQGISLTYYEIAKEVGVSYATAKKYVDKLMKERIIVEHDRIIIKHGTDKSGTQKV